MYRLGIDIAKKSFDGALTSDNKQYQSEHFNNTAKGHRRLVKWLRQQGVEEAHVCMEATGRYGDELARFLHEQGYRVSMVNPMQIHAYGKSQLRRNKNDRLDAQLIADFCFTQEPPTWTLPTRCRQETQELTRHITTLKHDRQRKRNQLKAGLSSEALRRSIEKNIGFIDQEIEHLEAKLQELIDQESRYQEDLALLLSIPAIGWTTATRFLAEVDVSQFAQASHLAAYAGLAPSEHSSGSSVHKKACLSKVGNRHLRSAFYMPALGAHRHNPIIADLVERLTARGKSKMTIVGAVMRKLLHLAYGVLKTRKPFDPLHVPPVPVGA
jgi:transposase